MRSVPLNKFFKRSNGLEAVVTRRILEDRLDSLVDEIAEAAAADSRNLPLLIDRAFWLDELYAALLPALAGASNGLAAKQPLKPDALLPAQAGLFQPTFPCTS
jgi:hypothetical protein